MKKQHSEFPEVKQPHGHIEHRHYPGTGLKHNHYADSGLETVVLGDEDDHLPVIVDGDCGGLHSCGGFCNKASGHHGKHYCYSCKTEF